MRLEQCTEHLQLGLPFREIDCAFQQQLDHKAAARVVVVVVIAVVAGALGGAALVVAVVTAAVAVPVVLVVRSKNYLSSGYNVSESQGL